jgi:hypothetical protein
MKATCQELQELGKAYDAKSMDNPCTELRSVVLGELDKRMQAEGWDSPTIARIQRERFAHEYAADRINEFLIRFTLTGTDGLTRYPTKRLRSTLIETRQETARRIKVLFDLDEKESDRVWEEEADESERAEMRAWEEELDRRFSDLRSPPPCPRCFREGYPPVRPPLRSR